MTNTDEITAEYRFRELRTWLLARLRSTERQHESLRDNHIDITLSELFRARRILNQWSAEAPHYDQYLITGFHEELSWIHKQLDFLQIVDKKKDAPTPRDLHPNQTTLV